MPSSIRAGGRGQVELCIRTNRERLPCQRAGDRFVRTMCNRRKPIGARRERCDLVNRWGPCGAIAGQSRFATVRQQTGELIPAATARCDRWCLLLRGGLLAATACLRLELAAALLTGGFTRAAAGARVPLFGRALAAGVTNTRSGCGHRQRQADCTASEGEQQKQGCQALKHELCTKNHSLKFSHH